MAAVAALIVLVGAIGVSRTLRQEYREDLAELHAAARAKSDMLSIWLAQVETDKRQLAAGAGLDLLYQEWRLRRDRGSELRFASYLDALKLGSQYSQVSLLDAGGALLLGDAVRLQSPDAAAVARLREALALGKPLSTGLYLVDDGSGRALRHDLVIPLHDAAGRSDAALVLRADPPGDMLDRLFRIEVSEDAVQFVLFHRLGDQVELAERSADGRGWHVDRRPLAGSPLSLGRALQPGAGGTLEGDGPHGQAVYGEVVAVAGSDWFVAAQAPQARLDAAVWKDAAWIAIADLLALALALGGVYMFGQRRALQEAVRHRALQQEQLRALQLLEAISNETTEAVFAKDTGGRYIFANLAMARLVGRSVDGVLGRDASAFFPPAEVVRLEQLRTRVMNGGRVVGSQLVLTTPAGRRDFASTLGPLHDAAGQVIGMFGVSRDITECKREDATRRQWAMAFENTRDGVMIADPRSRIVAINRAFTQITGYAEGEVLGLTPALLHSGRQGADFYRALWRSLRASGNWQGEIWNRRKSGEIYPEWLSISTVRDEHGAVINYVAVFTDITRIKAKEAELERLAQYDPLTGLPNRHLLNARLVHALERGQRAHGRTAVLYIDLDGFKTVNDSLGHPAGDELLVTMAARLRARVRHEDTLGRLGGDEFLVVLESIATPDEASVVARDLLRAVAEPVRLAGGQEVYVTASIGISVHPDDHGGSPVELMRDADAAMYRAKDEGRNCYRFYSNDLYAEATAKLDLEAALSRALERREFRLFYQPKIDARSGRLAGVEALLRWQRNGELVQPGQFIPLAERSSLILDIGAWVIDEACRQLRAWMDAGLAPPTVAVNVAARQFAAGDLDAVVRAAMARHDVPPELLQLELTESMLVARPEETAAMLARLQQLGLSLALDDFGTGYCNLGYLQRFPIDTLKIDQSFVRRIGEAQDGAALVDAIVGLGHRLHLRIVAEGVETEAQAAYLRGQGCDDLQGYLFSVPIPAGELEARFIEAPVGDRCVPAAA
jgi:diguanylate cyclase (GGDEF)-like protein/PAS domain S-box-containing protein